MRESFYDVVNSYDSLKPLDKIARVFRLLTLFSLAMMIFSPILPYVVCFPETSGPCGIAMLFMLLPGFVGFMLFLTLYAGFLLVARVRYGQRLLEPVRPTIKTIALVVFIFVLGYLAVTALAA